MTIRLHLRLFAGLSCIGSIACAGSPEPGWQSPQMIAQAGTVRRDSYAGRYPPEVAVAIDGQGRGWAVWDRKDPARIEGALLMDGTWQPPVIVRDCALDVAGVAGRDCTGASVALNDGGRTTAGWTELHGLDWVAMASEWQAGAWEAAVRVQEEPTGIFGTRGRSLGLPSRPMVSLDAAGVAWMLWSRRPAGAVVAPPASLKASHSAAPRSWSYEAMLVSEAMLPGYVAAPAVAFREGERYVAWTDRRGLQCAVISPTLPWRSVQVSGTSAYKPWLTALPNGRALVAWAGDWLPRASEGDVKVVTVTPDLSVGEPTILGGTARDTARLTASADGTVFAVWPTGAGIVARTAHPEAAFGDPQVLATDGTARQVQLSADATGDAVVVWLDGAWNETRLATARLSADGRWSPVKPLYIRRADPKSSLSYEKVDRAALATDRLGNAAVVFSSASGDDVTIYGVQYRAR